MNKYQLPARYYIISMGVVNSIIKRFKVYSLNGNLNMVFAPVATDLPIIRHKLITHETLEPDIISLLISILLFWLLQMLKAALLWKLSRLLWIHTLWFSNILKIILTKSKVHFTACAALQQTPKAAVTYYQQKQDKSWTWKVKEYKHNLNLLCFLMCIFLLEVVWTSI